MVDAAVAAGLSDAVKDLNAKAQEQKTTISAQKKELKDLGKLRKKILKTMDVYMSRVKDMEEETTAAKEAAQLAQAQAEELRAQLDQKKSESSTDKLQESSAAKATAVQDGIDSNGPSSSNSDKAGVQDHGVGSSQVSQAVEGDELLQLRSRVEHLEATNAAQLNELENLRRQRSAEQKNIEALYRDHADLVVELDEDQKHIVKLEDENEQLRSILGEYDRRYREQ